MATILQAVTAGTLHLTLQRRELIELADARGLTLTCLAGALWVTVAGSPEDRILVAGEHCVLDGSGSVVISACRAARLRLAAAGTAPALRAGRAPRRDDRRERGGGAPAGLAATLLAMPRPPERHGAC